MPTVEEVHAKVQRLLQANLERIEIDKDNDFVIRYESVIAFVGVKEGFGSFDTFVRVFSPLVLDVPLTDELYRWVATEGQSYSIGGSWIRPADDGRTGAVYFGYGIVGDDLDESELMAAIYAVTFSSNDLDNLIKDRFGGRLFGPES